MKFEIRRKIEKGVYSVSVKHASFGGNDFNAEEEKRLLKSFGAPAIDIGGKHEGTFKYDPLTGEVNEDSDGQNVSIVLNSQKLMVDEHFYAEFKVKLTDIPESLVSENLPSRQSVIEAKCLLFEKMIENKLKEVLEKIKNNYSNFESGYPKEITI